MFFYPEVFGADLISAAENMQCHCGCSCGCGAGTGGGGTTPPTGC